ncbi:MAG: DUF5914 domain-containing protein [Polyangiales bacterium]
MSTPTAATSSTTPATRPATDKALPDWRQADPAYIASLVQQAQQLSGGGWYVLAGSADIGPKAQVFRVCGRELVAWRHGHTFWVAPNRCPHMGASLAGCSADAQGALTCPWHGLKLGPAGQGRWQPLPVHHDGLLLWVQLLHDEAPTDRPALPPRPARQLCAVIHHPARCAPEDILANRFDPWHAAHFHPHSFAGLRLLERGKSDITVRVRYRLWGTRSVEVDACFFATDRRSIIMQIIRGEGRDSIVETHACPMDEGQCMVVEAAIATSERPGFRHFLKAAPWLSRLLAHRSRKLWVEDAEYAERRYALRQAGRVT